MAKEVLRHVMLFVSFEGDHVGLREREQLCFASSCRCFPEEERRYYLCEFHFLVQVCFTVVIGLKFESK